MRLTICGAHGVGKTTLAKALSERLGLPLIPEVARDLQAEGFPILSETDLPTLETQFAIFGKMLYLEQLYARRGGFVSDRSLLDNVAYFRLVESADWVWDPLVSFAREYAKHSYDLIVYVPIEFDLKGDGVRSTDREIQRFIDGVIRVLLLGIPHLVVSGSVEERVSKVLRKVGGRDGVDHNDTHFLPRFDRRPIQLSFIDFPPKT